MSATAVRDPALNVGTRDERRQRPISNSQLPRKSGWRSEVGNWELSRPSLFRGEAAQRSANHRIWRRIDGHRLHDGCRNAIGSVRQLEAQADANPSRPDRTATGSRAFDTDVSGLGEKPAAGNQRAPVLRMEHDKAIARILREDVDDGANVERAEIDPVRTPGFIDECVEWLRRSFQKFRIVCGHGSIPSAQTRSKPFATSGVQRYRRKSGVFRRLTTWRAELFSLARRIYPAIAFQLLVRWSAVRHANA